VRIHDGPHVRQAIRIESGPDEAFIPPGTELVVGLAGEHQTGNAVTALAALEKVRGRFPGLTLPALQEGLAAVQWEGRLQLLSEGPGRPTVLIDSAHNDDSAAKLVAALHEDYLPRGDHGARRRLILVFGAPEDKNIAGMLTRLLPLTDLLIVTTANHPRSATPERLAEMAAALGCEAILSHSVSEGVRLALDMAGPDDLICATGSIIVIGDLLNHWDDLKSETMRDQG
jgi:dihydrofolate synthase/folylpolyglutamate synthase